MTKTDPDGRAAIKSVSYSIDKWDSKTQTISVKDAKLTFRFKVGQDYRGSDQYEVDSVKTARAQTAAANAQSIVYAHAFEPTLEKLRSYKDEICNLTSYNYEAAAGGIAYGDPWQVIYVFDGDPDTKVVCEGYSKAFEYLCDMSSFDSGICCYSVTGTTSGKHMWNIVTLEPGKNVLADITNCDTGMIGADDLLFLVGYTEGSVADSYRFACKGSTMTYTYDQDTRDLMTVEQLTLIPADCSKYARVSRNLTLGEEIVLNVNVTIREGTSAADYTVDARFVNAEDVTTAYVGTLSDVADKVSDVWYRMSFAMAAKEMNIPVTVSVQYKGSPASEDKAYSVRDFCELYAASTTVEKDINMCKAILDYGAYAQLNFGYDTANLANRNLSSGVVEITAVPEAVKTVSGACSGISRTGGSMSLESAFEMNVTFVPTEAASAEGLANYSFTIDGSPAVATVQGGRYALKLGGLVAKDLGVQHTFQVTNKADGTTLTVVDWPNAYLYRAYNGGNTNLKNLSSAIYLYNQAAIAYFTA